MKREILFCLIFVLRLSCTSVLCNAQQQIDWRQISPNLYLAVNQNWHSDMEDVQFSAIKIHLGYYELSLVDVASLSAASRDAVQGVNDNRRFSSSLLDVGVLNIMRVWSKGTAVAVASAGWSATLRKVEQVGLLKIGGKLLSDYSDNPAMSAVICLDSPFYRGKGYDYQIPIFFRLDDDWQQKQIDKCGDALQVGPRIIEDVAKTNDAEGIDDRERKLRPQIRVVLAVDNPQRNDPPGKPKDRKNARNAYLLVTHNPVHLLSVQEMLKSNSFYGGDSTPAWAVNLVNGGPSGLAVRRDSFEEPMVLGNPSGVFGSAIVVTRRQD